MKNGADVLETQHRGKRRLAYEIQKNREGIYIQINYQSDGSQIALVERAMRLSEEVIRFLTIKQEVPEVRKRSCRSLALSPMRIANCLH